MRGRKRQRKKNQKRIAQKWLGDNGRLRVRNIRRRVIFGAAAAELLLDVLWPAPPGRKSLKELGW